MIYEILSNTVSLDFSPPVIVPNFSPIEKAKAFSFGEKVYQRCFEDGNLTKDEVEDLGFWTEHDDAAYVALLDVIQDLKVEYFDNYFIPSRRESIGKTIKRMLGEVNQALQRKTYLYEYTCEYARDEACGVFLFKDYRSPLLFYRKSIESRISEEKIRGLIFDPSWRVIWSVCKDPQAIFGINLGWFNDNQLSLVYWSKVYDNLMESSEPPNQKMITDTVAVDGWMIKQSRKRDGEEKKSSINMNAGEVFLPVKDRRELKEVMGLNGPEAKSIIKSQTRDIVNKGDVNEKDFEHVKIARSMEINKINLRK